MALVKAFTIPGVRCWFYSNDHDPPHFHAKRDGQWEVRIRFLENAGAMIEFVWRNANMSRHDRKELTDLSSAHRDALLQEWEQIHAQDGD
jgi:hypothetical protein